MAVYKIFPFQDTTLYSMFPTMNTGIDPINQVSNLNFANNGEINWNQGTGTYLDQPLTTDGACWESPFFALGDQWPINTPDNYGTPSGSYNAKYAAIGGGAWYTGSTSTPLFNITSSFGPRSDKDLNVIVDDIVHAWTSSELPNHGFLLKWEGYAEFNPNKLVQPVLQYYGVDTNLPTRTRI
jgi:hypothetical protein